MGGFSSITSDESIMNADNASFDGTERSGKMTTNGELWIGSTASPHVKKGTLTSPDNSILVNYSSPNITLRSNSAVVPDLHTAKWIVNSTPNAGGNQTTITAAISVASVGDTIFVMPGATGTYTENFTLPAGINITAFNSDQSTPHVTIIGKVTMTAAGTSTISNIRLQTNSDFAIAVTGSAASILNLNNCYINSTNNAAISYTSSSSSSGINFNNCAGDLGSNTAFFVSSSPGNLTGMYCIFTNSAGATTASTVSAGKVDLSWSSIKSPITSSGTANINGYNTQYDCGPINTIAITHGGSGSLSLLDSCRLASGSAACITTSQTIGLTNCTFDSSNTNPITGAGTVLYDTSNYLSTGFGNNTTTQTARYQRYGIAVSSRQPCFLAIAGAQTDVTGDGTLYTITFASEIFDQNNNFDGTSTFTAPVTGKYLFTQSVQLGQIGAGMTIGTMSLVATSRTINFWVLSPVATAASGVTLQLSGTAIVDMTAGDTAVCKITISGGAKVVDVAGGQFSGYLIC